MNTSVHSNWFNMIMCVLFDIIKLYNIHVFIQKYYLFIYIIYILYKVVQITKQYSLKDTRMIGLYYCLLLIIQIKYINTLVETSGSPVAQGVVHDIIPLISPL